METRNYLANAAGSPPPKPSSPSNGYPQSATPGVNEATTPGPFWFYKVGEELRSLIEDAGLTPSDDDLQQITAAIKGRYVRGDIATTHKLTLVNGCLALEEI